MSTDVEVLRVVASVHFKSLDAGDKKKELDSEFEQQRKAIIEAAVQQQTQSARTTANSPAAKQVGQNGRIASDTAEGFHFSSYHTTVSLMSAFVAVDGCLNSGAFWLTDLLIQRFFKFQLHFRLHYAAAIYLLFSVNWLLIHNSTLNAVSFISSFYSASAYLAMQSAVLAIVNPSVCLSICPSVRHTLALSQNDSSDDHGVFTGG